MAKNVKTQIVVNVTRFERLEREVEALSSQLQVFLDICEDKVELLSLKVFLQDSPLADADKVAPELPVSTSVHAKVASLSMHGQHPRSDVLQSGHNDPPVRHVPGEL